MSGSSFMAPDNDADDLSRCLPTTSRPWKRALSEGVAIEALDTGAGGTKCQPLSLAGSSPFDWLAQGWVLKVAIAAVVAVLIWVLVAAAKQVEEKEVES